MLLTLYTQVNIGTKKISMPVCLSLCMIKNFMTPLYIHTYSFSKI